MDAGDTFHGLMFINLSQGSNMARLMNLSGYDAMTPGNHDFNFGSQRLIELAGMLNFPVSLGERGVLFLLGATA